MKIAEIEESIQKLAQNLKPTTFVFDLLSAYGKPKASITRLQNGTYNLSKTEGEIIWKKNVFFKELKSTDLHATIDRLHRSEEVKRHDIRFVVVTDYKTLLAVDTKTRDTLDIPISDLGKRFDFFLPWAGLEKATTVNENPADIRAAERMAKLYDEIRKQNPKDDEKSLHSLNVFLSRVLFCLFAEDTDIFEKALFTKSIQSLTQPDGSDLGPFLDKLFMVLNLKDRSKLPKYLNSFEYVNGGLFAERSSAPRFSRKSRDLLIEAGELDWSAINPDIFGSMIQAVVNPGQRGEMGMHYTSVSNIMKVIKPLFLNELYDEFRSAGENQKKLDQLLLRMSKIRVFDPACGSGNFLIVAYRALRKLEIDIFFKLQSLRRQQQLPISKISLSNFYGIELDDFAHEIAILSLWLAEHQMNLEMKKAFGSTRASLPLQKGANIKCGNALQVEWESVCPKSKINETYLLGNPPYKGARFQSKEQKADLEASLASLSGRNNLDYIAGWFFKGSEYIQNSNSQLAFVSTSSICQGSQVSLLWPEIEEMDLEISFAHSAFKWANNAKNNAAVSCVIVGIRNSSNGKKYIYDGKLKHECANINGYLVDADNVSVRSRTRPVSNLPPMAFGSMPNDGGNLMLEPAERDELVSRWPESQQFIRRAYGAEEFLNGQVRYCIWIEDNQVERANQIPGIRERIEKVQVYRRKSRRAATKKLASVSHRFGEVRYRNSQSIIVPSVSSERRVYIPMGFLGPDAIITNLAFAVYNAEPWMFAFLTSAMHLAWVRTVAGQLESRIRYSAKICYNSFPIPQVNAQQREALMVHALNVLAERERHPEITLGDLYDPDKFPDSLKKAHADLDLAVDRCYRAKGFSNNEDRMATLFSMYQQQCPEEQDTDEGDGDSEEESIDD